MFSHFLFNKAFNMAAEKVLKLNNIGLRAVDKCLHKLYN